LCSALCSFGSAGRPNACGCTVFILWSQPPPVIEGGPPPPIEQVVQDAITTPGALQGALQRQRPATPIFIQVITDPVPAKRSTSMRLGDRVQRGRDYYASCWPAGLAYPFTEHFPSPCSWCATWAVLGCSMNVLGDYVIVDRRRTVTDHINAAAMRTARLRSFSPGLGDPFWARLDIRFQPEVSKRSPAGLRT
jgi:hypothetical protein